MDDRSSLNQQIARRVRDLRNSQNLSLEALSERTGVSRSMISLIERAECSPTALVLEKLAVGLGVMLASLFNVPKEDSSPRFPLARAKEQPEWRDPDSGYLRRNISPPDLPQAGQVVEVRFPAAARLIFDSSARETEVHQHIWILEGTMEIGVGEERYLLHTGDCLLMQHDKPILYHNPTSMTARYAVFTVTNPQTRRST